MARVTRTLARPWLQRTHDYRYPVTEYAEIARATDPDRERAMATATLAASRVSGSRPERVLLGGLGLGFTLAELLGDAHVVQVTVVEIEPTLVSWMRDATISHGPALVADPRVELRVGDIADTLRESPPAAYDLVLLDVDNGPGYLVHESNAALYEEPLLQAARAALRPGGTLVIWSAFEEPELPGDVAAVFGSCRSLAVPVERQGRQEHHWLYAASCPLP